MKARVSELVKFHSKETSASRNMLEMLFPFLLQGIFISSFLSQLKKGKEPPPQTGFFFSTHKHLFCPQGPSERDSTFSKPPSLENPNNLDKLSRPNLRSSLSPHKGLSPPIHLKFGEQLVCRSLDFLHYG